MSKRSTQAMALSTTLALGTALALAAGAAAGTPAAGTRVTGTVTVVGARSNANAVVYIKEIPGQTFAAPAEPAVVDQRNLEFLPKVMPVLVGTTVEFHNDDAVLHNVFTPDKIADRFDLGTFPKGEVRSHTFDKAGAAVLLCNVHPEMEGYVLVVPTPYYAVTDAEGRYRLEEVPSGTYTVEVWHPNLRKPLSETLTVGASGEVTASFQVGPR